MRIGTGYDSHRFAPDTACILGGVEIPDGVQEVTIRARDSVHGYGGAELSVELPR